VYSYGVLLWELLTGQRPFADQCSIQIQSEDPLRTFVSHAETGLAALMRECFKAAQRRPTFAEIIERFRAGGISFPGSDEQILNDYMASAIAGSPRPLPPLAETEEVSVARELQGCLEKRHLRWLEQVAEDRQRAIAFMRACVWIVERCEDGSVCRNALFALRHLWSLNLDFLTSFAELTLQEQVTLGRQELAGDVLSLLLPLLTLHPETASDALIHYIITCASAYPKRVLALFTVLCRSFTDDNILWEVADSMFLNADLFLSAGLGKQLCGIIYSLLSHCRVFQSERSCACNELFRKCLRSHESSMIEMAYLMLTDLGMKDVAEPGLLFDHFVNPETHRGAFRYLTVASLEDLSPEIVDHVVAAREQQLAIAVLWRFATVPLMVPAIFKNEKAIALFADMDVFRLILLAATSPDNRELLQNCGFLPQLLKAISATDDMQVLLLISKFIRVLPINPLFLRKLERSEFLITYLRHGFRHIPLYPACYLIMDKLMRVRLPASMIEFLPVMMQHLEEDGNLELYIFQLLVLFSAYPHGRSKLAELGIVENIRHRKRAGLRERALMTSLLSNMQKVQPPG
jgi:hypothetical protein